VRHVVSNSHIFPFMQTKFAQAGSGRTYPYCLTLVLISTMVRLPTTQCSSATSVKSPWSPPRERQPLWP